MHREDNETKVLVANINSKAEADRLALVNRDNEVSGDQKYELDRLKLEQSIKESEAKMQREDDALRLDRQKHEDNLRLKERQLRQQAGK